MLYYEDIIYIHYLFLNIYPKFYVFVLSFLVLTFSCLGVIEYFKISPAIINHLMKYNIHVKNAQSMNICSTHTCENATETC